ncbi:hypothetical protein PQR34_29000 [Paraburkholderia sediminicola]|uniref:surface-adhesin E family protein n=1 Tax=Paraburkholderia sediminicola TaxID=458836 RepID=UPI0038BCF965
MRRLLLAAALLCIGSTAQATHWVDIGGRGAQTGSHYTVDVDSIQRSGSTVSFWHKAIFDTPQPDNGVLYNEIRAKSHIDCVNHTDHATTISERFNGEIVAQSERYDLDNEPGTMGEALEQFVCKK